MKRREFFKSFFGGTVAVLALSSISKIPGLSKLQRYLRPPGALSETEFLKACIGCGQCANVCPNQCISMSGLESGLESLNTPQIVARAKGCTLCMACTKTCPTGALTPLENTKEGHAKVEMGKAVLFKDSCYSYHGRTCGVCYRACPLQGTAMTIGLFEQPTVHEKFCVGCGLCEQACIHMPQAIRVTPREDNVKPSWPS